MPDDIAAPDPSEDIPAPSGTPESDEAYGVPDEQTQLDDDPESVVEDALSEGADDADVDPESEATEPDDSESEATESADSEGEATGDEADDETAPDDGAMLDPGQIAVADFFGPPRIDRDRHPRPQLIPQWIYIVGITILASSLLWLGSVWWSSLAADISTPEVVGVDVDTAQVRLEERGLKISVAERRFSPKAKDTVLSQNPVEGTKLNEGDTVVVIVSAGSEQFAVPDVVGSGLLLARGLLQAEGLDIAVDAQPSQQPSDTVLASNPPAGSLVHTGDIIHLTVAAPGAQTSQLLLPYEMKGVRVLIDPAPVSDPLADAPLDIARRLRALVEASHGTVVTTRALAGAPGDIGAARGEKAAAASATVAVGLSAAEVGGSGLVVYAPSPVLPYASQSSKLASIISSDLASRSSVVKASTLSSDSVLVGARSPWIRVQLGSMSQKDDVARFKDPAWEDSVARALYKGIAARYGRKTAVSQ
jgi:hypothetical protein